MELQTISQISRQFNISTRTLRYYEQIGLIQPKKKDDFAYRTYDEDTIVRLQQIIVLRKLRIPLRQIADILKSEDSAVAIHAFSQNLTEIEDEITALNTIKSVIETLLNRLHLHGDTLRLLDDESLLDIVDSLTVSKINFKEEKTMEYLNKASEELLKMKDSDVRIIYLPPMTIASFLASGEDCEGKASGEIGNFVKANNLADMKPDLRCFGFDCSKGATGIGAPSKAYEVWVSIPDDMEVLNPLIKKNFIGGMYAAHVLRAWDFQDWRRLAEWVRSSDKYHSAVGEPRCTGEEYNPGQGFEEILNYRLFSQTGKDMQLDLLFPITEK